MDEKPTPNKHSKRNMRFNVAIPAKTAVSIIIILMLTAVSAFYTNKKFVDEVNASQIAHLSLLEARKHADEISLFLQNTQKQLNMFASRTSMVTVIQSDNASIHNAIIDGLNAAYPEALSKRLFTLDRKEHLNTADRPISFVELDMINRAERSEAVAPEAVRTNNRWELLYIAPVTRSRETDVVGTLLIAMPANNLFKRIANMSPELGQVKLLRESKNKNVLIFQSGSGTGRPSFSEVKNSHWRVEFTPSPKFIDQVSKSSIFLFCLHGIIAAILILLAWFLTGKPRLSAAASDHSGDEDSSTANLGHVQAAAHDILNINLSADQDILVLEEHEHDESLESSPNPIKASLPESVFRAYDIRGKTDTEITPEFARLLGQAFASEALATGESSLFVARDGRVLSPLLCDELIGGIISTGCTALDLGAVPTPLMYFATHELVGSHSGIMVTASHNSAEYNGFKMVIRGKTLVAEDVQKIKHRMQSGDFFQGQGEVTATQVIPEYIDRIFSDVALAGSVKLVIDAGNGITGGVAPLLFDELGCEVVPLYCDIDGNFPNHDPDPTIVGNLNDLIKTVQETGADLGIALDGDGDRLVVVTPKGEIIWPDRLLMLFAKDIVSGNPGADVIFDVKSTRELNSLVSSYGGRPIMWKTGHSNMKTKMQETGALIGGEMSGHIFFKDRWYGFDDGMYAAARLLEIMTLRDQDIDSLFASFPSLPSTPEIKISVSEENKFTIIDKLKESARFEDAQINPLDGLRVEFPEGWGLVRASNTSPALTLRFEAETEEQLQQIQALFKRELLKVDSSLDIPF